VYHTPPSLQLNNNRILKTEYQMNSLTNENSCMAITKDLRDPDSSMTVAMERARRSLMLRELIFQWLGREGEDALVWLFTRARGSREIMADILEDVSIPSSSMEDEFYVGYIKNKLSHFRRAYEYVLYGSAEIERAWTEEQWLRSQAQIKEYRAIVLNRCASGEVRQYRSVINLESSGSGG